MLSYCLKCKKILRALIEKFQLNDIVNIFLLAGDKFMPELQPGFNYSAGGPFPKNK